MFAPDQYELIDFGEGRRLERFAGVTLDRPCPAAVSALARPSDWASADGRYERGAEAAGRWFWKQEPPDDWTITHGEFSLRLNATKFGHLGVFPEQAANWDWITRRVQAAGRPLNVLNLFAYTGGATLAAAAAGATVVHVDAAKNVVGRARRNARASGLQQAAVRWIVEDAATFVRREMRRGNRYDAVILDPPSYGHGPKGQAWKLTRDLPKLLKACAELTADRRAFLLLTCHTPGYGPPELEALTADVVFGACSAGVTAGALGPSTADGRTLPAGVVARWP